MNKNKVHRAVTQADIDGNEAIGADNLKVGDMAWFEVDKLKYRVGRKLNRVILTVNGEETIAHVFKPDLVQPICDFLNGQEQQDRWISVDEEAERYATDMQNGNVTDDRVVLVKENGEDILLN